MEKVVIFKTSFDFIKKNRKEIDFIVRTFPDIDIWFSVDVLRDSYEQVNEFKNFKIIQNKIELMDLSKSKWFKENPIEAVLVEGNYLSKVTPTQRARSEDVVKMFLDANKKVVLTLKEEWSAFSRNKGSRVLIEKVYDILGLIPKKQIDNLYINYEFSVNNSSTTNEHIDDMIKVIRSTIESLYNRQIPVLIGGNISAENIVSYCISNNFDGFVIDGKNAGVESLWDVVRVVHGWQRLIRNQALRRSIK